MDEGSLSSIAAVAALVLLHGVVELAYAAIMNVRRAALKEQAERGENRARRILDLTENLAKLTSTKQILLMLIRFALVAVATVNLADTMRAQGSSLFTTPGLGYAAVLVPIALVTYLVGEVVPMALGQAYADQLAPTVTPLLRVLMFILSPFVLLFTNISRTLSRIAGAEDYGKAVTEQEIMTLVDVGQQGGAIENNEKEMIYSVLQFGETLAREVMIPRPDISAIEIDQPLSEAIKLFLESGHSRIPVFDTEIDNIKGLLYAKDLLKLIADGGSMQKPIREVMRPSYFVPETKRADTLFKEMQERKVHLAVVVDEYGGTAGLVTIEDLIEEIVGDIKDEYDLNEEAEYTQLGVDEYVVDGGMNLEDLSELLDVELENDDNDSIGGYVYSKLGHVPEIGETIEEPSLLMRVDAVENRRIRKVYIAKRAPKTAADEEREKADDEESISIEVGSQKAAS